MKVLILNTDLGYGGAEKILAFVANVLADADKDVTFLTFRENTSYQKLNKKVKREHIQLENIGHKLLSSVKTIFKLHSYIKKNNFDLAVAFLSPSQLRLILACKLTKTKVLVSQRGDPFVNDNIKGTKKIISRINNMIFKMSDYFVFQSNNAKKFYPNKIQERCYVIPNPVEPLKRTSMRDNVTIEKRIVTVSRLDLKQKRQDLLINAFRMFHKKYSDYVLELYGTGEDEQKINEIIGNDESIKLCGFTSNVVDAIQNASFFVLTSDYEGIPNALIEAMSLGVPSISTDCSPGGAAICINNNVNGLLVKRGDEDAILNAMVYMKEYPCDAEAMGKKGMEINEIYNPEKISQMWLEWIETIC